MSAFPILKITGPDGQRQEFSLERLEYTVGRSGGSNAPSHLSVTGDPTISRHHFNLRWENKTLTVTKKPGAKNPVYFDGVDKEVFEVKPGQSFVAGKSRFLLHLGTHGTEDTPITELTLFRKQFQDAAPPNVGECFKVLVELLPGLRESPDRAQAFEAALDVLHRLLPAAKSSSILDLKQSNSVVLTKTIGNYETIPPSNRLLRRAQEAKATVTYVWAQNVQVEMTTHSACDWAIASPINVAGVDQFAIYVVGTAARAFTETEALEQKEYLDGLASLIDMVAETLSHHLTVARLNRFEDQITRFFSPVLRPMLRGGEFSEVLKPQRRRVTVMFFDLRGFSRAAEQANEDLETVLAHHHLITQVMTAVTDRVFAEGGVVVDYQGDAVMACWGALADNPEADKALRASQAIVETIAQMDLPFSDHQANPMRCGIGLATGEVIAGQMGSSEQIKFGVLGSTVNLASRLEGLTKYLRVPILLTSDTRAELRDRFVCRRIGRVLPAGLSSPCELHEVVLRPEIGGSGVTSEQINNYEDAIRQFEQRRMNDAYQILASNTNIHDHVSVFLAHRLMRYLSDGVPEDFEAVLEFGSK